MPKHGILSCLGGGALYLLGWFCDRSVYASSFETESSFMLIVLFQKILALC